jgi:coenzyme F420 hydrogenase subunit beta
VALTRNSIEHVVEDGLCHRCGACLPMCPVPATITLRDDLYPQVNPDTCIECGVCERVCSGEALPLESLKAALPTPPHPNPSWGGFHQPWVAYASDPAARERGASGGFVTELLAWLLERGEIDGAVVAGMTPAAPWTAMPFIARTPDEVRGAAGSKYTAVPMASIMDEIIGKGHDRYAFVGVSCNVHSLRMMMRARPHLQRKIRYTIGLLCKSAFDPDAITDLLRANGVELAQVRNVEYRAGPWPGVMRAELHDGRFVQLHYADFKDGVYNYLMSLYTQPRCWTCYDFGNELADVAVGDPWGRDPEGRYEFPGGHSLLIPRTAAGLSLVEAAREEPRFRFEAVSPEYVIRVPQRYAEYRAQSTRRQLEILQARGRPIPQYDRELPHPTPRTRRREALLAIPTGLSRYPRLRYALLRVLISRPALAFVYLRQLAKYGLSGFRHTHQPAAPSAEAPVPAHAE